jgi:glycosyltransferase involved in cell wall biosynthesis
MRPCARTLIYGAWPNDCCAADIPVDISVIIPAFNRLWCLPRAVESCKNTRCRTEIIVVDDGSTDGTWDWLQKQSGVVAVRQPNQGQTWAVNHGIRHAKGRYFRFLDSDDYLAPGTIDRQFERAQATGAQVVYGRVDDYNEATHAVREYPDTPEWDDFTAVMLGEGYGSHFLGMQFARELVENAPRRPEFALREDRMFLLEIALQHPTVAAIPGCAGYWVHHEGQMHTGYRGLPITLAAAQMIGIYRRTLGRLAERGELTPRRIRAAVPVIWTAAHALARTHLEEAAAAAAWCRELQPDFVPQEAGGTRLLYGILGYRATQRLFRLRRAVLRRG